VAISGKSAFISVLALAIPFSVSARITPLDKASFTLAVAIPDNSTEIDFNTNIGDVPVDFSRDLGLETDNIIAVASGTWRPWDNHQFGLAYFNNSDSNSRSLANPIEWNGVAYDGTVKAGLDIATYDFSYIWWGLNRENYALGPSIRLSYITVDTKIDLTVDADGNPVADGSYRQSGNTDIPAPTLGAAWRWVPADNWRINLEAGYMQASISDFDGSALVASGGVAWFPRDHWGFSLNAVYMDFDVDTANTDFSGDLNIRQANYNFGITYRF